MLVYLSFAPSRSSYATASRGGASPMRFEKSHFTTTAAGSSSFFFLPRRFGSAASAVFLLFGQTRYTPSFNVFSSRYGLPHSGHFSATGLYAEVNSQLG